MMQTLSGQSLGRYQLLEPLGEGGMATVYRAFDTLLERPVAVKVIRTDFGADPQFLKRFEREARALAQLNHPNIVHVLDAGEQDGRPYVVMEYLPGGTLKSRTGRPLPPAEAAALMAPIARALDFAHGLGIIHRDVKPANILLTPNGEPKLSDFGIAKVLERPGATELTATGVGVGTPDYMAPEQWLGQPTPRSDIYALGVVFFELLTGRRPYVADTPVAVLLKHVNDPLPNPRQFVPNIPEAAEQVLIKALAKKPEARFQSMAAFADALDKLRVAAPKPRLPGRAWTGIALGVIGLGAAALACVGIWAVWSLGVFNRPTATPTVAPPKQQPTTISPTPVATARPTEAPTASVPAPTPALALTGGRVAFYSARDGNLEIYVMDPDGSHQVNLTRDNAMDWLPAWSPDGMRLAFVSDREGNEEIYVMDPEGGGLTRLTNDPGKDEAPTFSPDGRRLAFQSDRSGTPVIYVMNSDGSNPVPLTSDAVDSGLPKWSPDGSRILFQSKRDGDWDVYVMNADGSAVRNLSNNVYVDVAPDWSPDGTRVVFASNRDSDHYEIYTMAVDGGDVRRLTRGSANSWTPAWSADGVHIYYAAKVDDNYEIFVMNADGTGAKRLTQNAGHDQVPDDQPVGK